MPADPAATVAYILLGSNRDPGDHLRQAVALLRRRCEVLAVSSVYETAAQAGASGRYWNAAVKLATTDNPVDFKMPVLREIERQLKRNRETKDVVTIDLDIAIWGSSAIDYGTKPWHSPSPEVARFGYAAIPLAEIAPDLVHPETGQTLGQIAASFADASVVKVSTHRLDVE